MKRLTSSLITGVTDEMAFAEECRRRGQNALPSSSRSSRPHRPPVASRHSHTYITDEDEEQDRPRVTGLYGESHLYSAGHKDSSKRKRPKLREEKKLKPSRPYH